MHRSAGKSPGFISWPCHMTWGQGYQRLPPHMERISGHQLQQLLVSSPVSILYSAHACALLKTQTRQPWSATAIEMMDELHVCPQPVTPAGSRPKARTPFCTHLLSLEGFLFPAGRDISVRHIPKLRCIFQTSYLLPSKPVPLQWSDCIYVKWDVFWLGITGSNLPCLWYCETSVRSSVGELYKDLGCVTPCHDSLLHEICKLCYSLLARAEGHHGSNDREGLESGKRNVSNQRLQN